MIVYERVLWAALLILLLLDCSPVFGKENPEEKGRSLLKAAAERSLFRLDVGSSLNLALSFSLRSPSSKLVPGKYNWFVTPEGDWRKEITFLDYTDIEVKCGSSLWVKRNTAFRPLQAAWIEGAFGNHLYLDRAEDNIERYFRGSENHIEMQCVDIAREKSSRSLCFDREGNLRKVEHKDSKITYEYSDYRVAGRKFAPHKIVARRNGQVILDAVVDSLSADTKADARLLEPPRDATKRGGCLVPSLPKMKRKVPPNYPREARDARQQGQVIVYVLVGTDGAVRNPTVVQTAGPSLDSAAMDAVRRWQFEAAKCTDTPVEFETEIPINFTLDFR